MNSNNLKKELFIEGKIIITAAVRPFNAGITRITLEDTTYQDVRSVVLAETIIPNINHLKGETTIDFRLKIAEPNRINPKNDYVVRVRVQTGGGEKKSESDLYTDRVYPVLTRGFGNHPVIEFNENQK